MVCSRDSRHEMQMDSIERLECVYYPGPIPANSAVLTVLCFLFDKIHFPNVYLPKGDYDKELLRQQIQRLEEDPANNGRTYPAYQTQRLIGMLKFLDYRLPLDGILEFPASRGSIFGEKREKLIGKIANTIYDANYLPRKNFHPTFDSAHVKGLPQSEECVEYAGDFYYQAGAIMYAADKQIRLIDDGSGDRFGLTLPLSARYKDNAQALATLIAAQSLGWVLPSLPLLTPQEIVEFRVDNDKELRNFRASMLRYAKGLNDQLSNDPSVEELNRKVKFFVESEIAPTLHDLKRDLDNPNRPWHKRMTDVGKIASSVAVGYLTGGLAGRSPAEAITSAVLSDLEGRGDKQEALKRNGLYYLLKVRALRD